MFFFLNSFNAKSQQRRFRRAYFQQQFVDQLDLYDDRRQADLRRVHDVFLGDFEIGHYRRIIRRVDFEQPVVQHHGRFGVLVVVIFVHFVRPRYCGVHQLRADLQQLVKTWLGHSARVDRTRTANNRIASTVRQCRDSSGQFCPVNCPDKYRLIR